MESAGFGPVGTPGGIDEPWGHIRKDGVTTPTQQDNPLVISPAGRAHCSLADFAKYAAFAMEGEKKDGLLKAETMKARARWLVPIRTCLSIDTRDCKIDSRATIIKIQSFRWHVWALLALTTMCGCLRSLPGVGRTQSSRPRATELPSTVRYAMAIAIAS